MFERFTNLARHVVVLSQEEARSDRFRHNYIGTEHVLLGLLGEPRGLAARALDQLGVTLDQTRQDVLRTVGVGELQRADAGHVPFTPRAKRVLELSLREALRLNHTYIGTEHLLLGLVREGDGVAAAILIERAGSLEAVQAAVLAMLPGAPPGPGRSWQSEPASPQLSEDGPAAKPLRTTPAGDSGLDEAARLAGGAPVGSHHLVLAALTDPGSAAARALAALGVDLDQVRQALRGADVTGSTDELPEEAGRRQMQLTAADDRVTIELSDRVMVGLARAAADAFRDGPAAGDAGPAPVIRGDHPAAASLSRVWLALEASLREIGQRRAAERGAAGEAEPPPASTQP